MIYKLVWVISDYLNNNSVIKIFGYNDDGDICLESYTPVEGIELTRDKALEKLKEIEEWKDKDIK
jgi:hypothetical protein